MASVWRPGRRRTGPVGAGGARWRAAGSDVAAAGRGVLDRRASRPGAAADDARVGRARGLLHGRRFPAQPWPSVLRHRIRLRCRGATAAPFEGMLRHGRKDHPEARVHRGAGGFGSPGVVVGGVWLCQAPARGGSPRQGLHGPHSRRRPARQRPRGLWGLLAGPVRGGRRHECGVPDLEEHVVAAGARRADHAAGTRHPDDAFGEGPDSATTSWGTAPLATLRTLNAPTRTLARSSRLHERPEERRRCASPTQRRPRRLGRTTCRSPAISSTGWLRPTTACGRCC